MSYEVFQDKVNALIVRAGGGIDVRFNHDTDKGRFFAHCSDGTTIIGCPSALRVAVVWGSGHSTLTAI